MRQGLLHDQSHGPQRQSKSVLRAAGPEGLGLKTCSPLTSRGVLGHSEPLFCCFGKMGIVILFLLGRLCTSNKMLYVRSKVHLRVSGMFTTHTCCPMWLDDLRFLLRLLRGEWVGVCFRVGYREL